MLEYTVGILLLWFYMHIFVLNLVVIQERQQQQFNETMEHIVSACAILAEEQYIKRHDRVCSQLHFNKCKEKGKIRQRTLFYIKKASKHPQGIRAYIMLRTITARRNL